MSDKPTGKPLVIDPHVHHSREEWYAEPFWEMLSKQLASHITGVYRAATKEEARAYREKNFWRLYDHDGERLLAKMDQAGIDISFLMHDDYGLFFGETSVPIIEQNRAIAELAARHPTRLKAFCCVDPRRVDALELLERCVKEFGMVGVGECHPDAGWDPTSREAYRMYEKLQEWGVPVLTHTGLFFPPTKSRYDHPMLLDDVCSDFPDLKIIAAHSGRLLWWRTVMYMARVHPNFHGDLAGFQTLAATEPVAFCKILREMIDIAGAHKILWASDDPNYDELGIKTKSWIDLVRDLPHNAPEGLSFTQEEIELIIGGNARRIMDI